MHRKEIESGLAALVRENRFTIAVTFPIVGAILLVTSAAGWLPAPLEFNPILILFGTAVMRLPLIVGVLPLLDRRASFILLGLAGYTWGIEIIGVATGYPYGGFSYGVQLGPMLFGVPFALPLFFIPLVLNAYLLALLVAPELMRRPVTRIPLAVAFVIAIDLVLDPAAVALGFWSFDGGGAFYGVPWTNYAGWVLSGTVAVLAVDLAFSPDRLRQRIDECEFMLDDLVSFTLLWGSINALFGNLIPVMVTIGFIAGLLIAGRLDFLRFRTLRNRGISMRG